MKKILATILIITILLYAFLMTSCTTNNSKEVFTVGICQFVQHAALDQATQGFMAALKAELGEENVVFDVQNASGDTNVCNTIAMDFASKDVDLIMANATPALQAAYNATTSIPILGTSITEYGVALGIDDFNGIVGGNVSGTSDLAPLDKQADMILEIYPDVKTVGIVYCTAEANSKYQVDVMTQLLESKGITVTKFGFSDSSDLTAVVTAACAQSDALYVPTDNTAASCAETIGAIVREYKVPLFAGEENTAKGCGIASLTINYYYLGVATGKMAAKILKGEANISKMPIEYADATKKYNKEMCEFFGITVPEDYEAIK